MTPSACALLTIVAATAAPKLAARDAQISPDGQAVVFCLGPSQPDNAAREPVNLWRVPFAGGEPQRLTSDRSYDSHPRWSPDSRQIAFLSRGLAESRRTGIRLLSSSGGAARSVTGDGLDVSSFAWSPDGRRIAYVAEAGALWIQELTPPGRAAQRFAADGGSVTSFSWSPSGQAIAVVAGRSPSITHVAIVPMSGSPFEISSNADGADELTWSPDGTLIAWILRSAGADREAGRIVLASADRAAAPVVSTAAAGSPIHVSWAGARLSITVAGDQERHVDLLDVRSGQRETVLPPGIAFATGAASWSADGMRYAVAGSTAEHPAEVFAGSRPTPPPAGRDTVGAPPPPVRRITFSNP